VAVPLALVSSWLNTLLGLESAQRTVTSSQDFLSPFAAALPGATVSGLAYLLQGATIVRMASDAMLGRAVEVGSAYKAARQRYGSMLWMANLSSLVVGLLALSVLGLPLAVYLGIGWALGLHACVIEGLGGRECLRRSSTLVRGRRWQLLGVLVALFLVAAILGSLPARMVAALGIFDQTLAVLGLELPTARIANALVDGLAQSLVGSLAWIGLTVIYYELLLARRPLTTGSASALRTEPAHPL
jgi:hypothetical protein